MKTCAITGHRGVLGSSFIKNNPDIKYLKFKGDLSKKKDIHNFKTRPKGTIDPVTK